MTKCKSLHTTGRRHKEGSHSDETSVPHGSSIMKRAQSLSFPKACPKPVLSFVKRLPPVEGEDPMTAVRTVSLLISVTCMSITKNKPTLHRERITSGEYRGIAKWVASLSPFQIKSLLTNEKQIYFHLSKFFFKNLYFLKFRKNCTSKPSLPALYRKC